MARPKKERVICALPRTTRFRAESTESEEYVVLTLDEYEVIRLHSLEHLEQAQIASQMLVSRPTVAALLASAHQKLADALVNGKSIEISGGTCRVCEIGLACPKEKCAEDCRKRHRCKASCRSGCESCTP
ncbi:MAG: DUF134 domain-containing protein [Clostridia bacterium]|nr:DUF134 domain-containing protein [Clostridia bacterium]